MLVPLIRQALEDEWQQMRSASTLLAGFTRAVEVETDQPITSRQWNLFAAAVIERVLSGMGDTVFRCCEYLLSLYRSMLAPSEDGLKWHAEAEFFEVFQALRPNVANWPVAQVADSGLPEPEGPNVQNPMMAWVYGNVGAKLDNEADRLNAVPSSLNTDTPVSKWVQAKQQRGLVDPDTGYENAPARECALQFARLAYRKDGYFGLSYGGFLPGPGKLAAECEAPCITTGCTLPTRDNLQIYFTATRDDVAVPTGDGTYFNSSSVEMPAGSGTFVNRIEFVGTCLLCDDDECPTAGTSRCTGGSGEYCFHLYVHYELPLGWWCIFNDGTELFLPRQDWIEGPYTQVNALSHDYGDQIRRAVNGFNREFRGSDSQRAVEDYDNDEAFDYQAHGTAQNYMAPGRGVQSGDSISSANPVWRLGPGSWLSGQTMNGDFGSTVYSWASGFVGTHALAWLDTSDPAKTVRVTLKTASGDYSITASRDGQIVRLSDSRIMSARVELAEGATLDAGEQLVVEATELQEGKPGWWDLYVVLRKAGARLVGSGGGPGNQFTDGIGTDEEQARLIFSDYQNTGAIVNQADVAGISDPTSVNENAVYDAARRMYQTCRIMNRFALRDYSVEGGDSVLWFTPYPRTGDYPMTNPGDDGDPDIDLFEGMSVQRVPPSGGKNSRWVFGVWLKPFTTGAGSDLEDETYADQIPDVNRCVVDDAVGAGLSGDESFNRHTNRSEKVGGYGNRYGQAPSGWNYAQTFASPPENINHVGSPVTDEERIRFAKSCRIYEPPLEVRSIERVTEGNTNLVKVTLIGRLRNTSGETNGAPETIARSGWSVENTSCPTGGGGVALSPGGWNYDTIAAEPFACDERNLRLYLFHRWCDVHDVAAFTVGDRAQSAALNRWGDADLQSSIFPHFYWLKLPCQVRVDEDDVEDSGDAVHDHDDVLQSEWILRCMVEGALAGVGTLDCDDAATARAYDWTWRNLCQSLFGMPSAGAFASQTTDALGAVDVRPDNPEGFGPLPNTISAAEVFNRLVRIVNALTRWRVMLPWKAQYLDYTNTDVLADPNNFNAKARIGAGDAGCGGSSGCGISPSPTSQMATPHPGEPATDMRAVADDFTDLGWATVINASTSCSFGGCWWDGTGWTDDYTLATARTASMMRFDLIDPHIYLHAVPESWRGLVNEAAQEMGAVFRYSDAAGWYTAVTGPAACGSLLTCTFTQATNENTRCFFARNGVFTADCGALAPGGWKFVDYTDPFCGGGSQRIADIQLLNDTTPVVEFNLVDREEWQVVPS